MIKKYFFIVFINFLLIYLFLFIIELVLNIQSNYKNHSYGITKPYHYNFNKEFGFDLRNNIVDYRSKIFTNNFGARINENEILKQNDFTKSNIFIFGDSGIFGWGHENQYSIPNNIETLFRDRKKQEVKVHNFGVPAISNSQLKLKVKRFIEKERKNISKNDIFLISILWPNNEKDDLNSIKNSSKKLILEDNNNFLNVSSNSFGYIDPIKQQKKSIINNNYLSVDCDYFKKSEIYNINKISFANFEDEVTDVFEFFKLNKNNGQLKRIEVKNIIKDNLLTTYLIKANTIIDTDKECISWRSNRELHRNQIANHLLNNLTYKVYKDVNFTNLRANLFTNTLIVPGKPFALEIEVKEKNFHKIFKLKNLLSKFLHEKQSNEKQSSEKQSSEKQSSEKQFKVERSFAGYNAYESMLIAKKIIDNYSELSKFLDKEKVLYQFLIYPYPRNNIKNIDFDLEDNTYANGLLYLQKNLNNLLLPNIELINNDNYFDGYHFTQIAIKKYSERIFLFLNQNL